jgi:hypothetical protein
MRKLIANEFTSLGQGGVLNEVRGSPPRRARPGAVDSGEKGYTLTGS